MLVTWYSRIKDELSQYRRLGATSAFEICENLKALNTLRPRQNGRHFADDTFKRIFMNENVKISINISLKFVPN